jgi:SAM-dependent methyltransferase
MTTHFAPTRTDRRRFHIVTAEEGDPALAAGLVEHVLPLVPELPKALARGADVLDVGCGTGRALVRLAAAFPHSRFQGVDASELAIESARREARAHGLGNLRFDARDPAVLDEPSRFDLITTFAIHRQPAPAAVLAGIASALRPDGVFLMQENAAANGVAGRVSICTEPAELQTGKDLLVANILAARSSHMRAF